MLELVFVWRFADCVAPVYLESIRPPLTSMTSSSPPVTVYGRPVDDQTRCIHWASPRDVVAIQFYCCRRFYPCYDCHAMKEEDGGAGHPAKPWPLDQRDHLALLCGVCSSLLSIRDYLDLYTATTATADCPPSPHCPRCSSPFNPGCGKHLDLYFDLQPRQAVERGDTEQQEGRATLRCGSGG